MVANTFIVNVILSIVLTIISIITLLISCTLFSNLCNCCIRPKLSSLPSFSSVPTKSTGGSSVNSLSSKSKLRSKSKPKIHGFFKYASIICCIFFCIVCITINIDRILITIDPNYIFSWFSYIVWPCYFFGRMMLGLIFIGRLFFTFRGSALEYSKCTMNSLFIIWCLMPISAVLSVCLYNISLMITIILGSLFVLVDILLSCILLFLYLKKLFDLTSSEHDHNPKLIALMTRYSLLYSICFSTTFVVFLLLSLSPIWISRNIDIQSEVWCIVSADSIFNVLCLWLNFAFAKKWYFKLCKCCHNKCESCCINCTKTSEKQMITDEDELENETLKELREESISKQNDESIQVGIIVKTN